MAAPRADLNDLIAAVWGPTFERDYGMTMEEVAEFERTIGHMPPLKDGPFAGMLSCGPFHFGCRESDDD